MSAATRWDQANRFVNLALHFLLVTNEVYISFYRLQGWIFVSFTFVKFLPFVGGPVSACIAPVGDSLLLGQSFSMSLLILVKLTIKAILP